jgi:LacI family transcriptional regulator, galactose operon repressor
MRKPLCGTPSLNSLNIMVRIPRVALLIETSRGYGRGLLRGIVRYASLHGPWEFYLTPADFEQALPDMAAWGGTGIIARIETSRLARGIVDSGLPVIGLDISQNVQIDSMVGMHLHEIASDSHQAARMAAEHLLSRGVKRFAYIGDANRRWSQIRQASFQERLAEAGLDVAIYPVPQRKHDREWSQELPVMVKWLQDLNKPIGIMACNDDRGRQVLEACSAAGVRVPFEALVIGVDNDKLLCELARPPLSSIAMNAEAGGFRAAGLLDRLMRGQEIEPQQLLVEPLHVVERRSTEPYAMIEDEDVAAALDFLQTHAAEPIGIEDLVSQIGLSRRTLEIRFRKIIGRTPHEELRRLRLVRAKRLLLETDHSISKIAFAAGFCSPTHLSQTFHKQTGMTPSQYRRAHRT